jgi:hypothetical protein
MPPRRLLLPQKVPLPPQGRAPRVAAEIRHGLRGRDGGAKFVVALQNSQLKKMPHLVPKPAQALIPAPLSTEAATLPPEPRPRQLRPARPAHLHRNSVARARAPSLFPWPSPPRVSFGASSARSSICAYSLLLAYQRRMEQSTVPSSSPDTPSEPSGHRMIESQKQLNLDRPITRSPDHPIVRCPDWLQ